MCFGYDYTNVVLPRVISSKYTYWWFLVMRRLHIHCSCHIRLIYLPK